MSSAAAIDRQIEQDGQAIDAKLAEKPSTRATGTSLAIGGEIAARVPMPTTYSQVMEMSQLMAKGGPLVGKAFRNNPAACVAIIQQALRFNFDPYMLSQKAYLVGDTIGYEAQAVHAIILTNAPLLRRPRFSYSGEDAARRCRVEFHVEGEPEPLDYDSPEIGKIPTKNSPLWKGDPDQQLGYYSVRAAARRHFPDIIMGVYTPDELQAGLVEDTQGTHRDVISLSEGASGVRDAEFTSVDALLNKNAPAKEKAASPKTDDQGADGGAGMVAEQDDQPQTATVEADAGSEGPTDEQIVAKVEADVKAAKTGKVDIIRAARGALTRIEQTSGDAGLKKRAHALLNRFDLD